MLELELFSLRWPRRGGVAAAIGIVNPKAHR
jgi:hypothetical protein